MGLIYKTRGNSLPNEKPRVFFACYKDDFHSMFDNIASDILELDNCVIWYCDNCDYSQIDFDEFSKMQLLVISITKNLLTKDKIIIKKLIPFAIQHQIPILPIMVEYGLDSMFAEKCGDIEYLDKTSFDITAIPYKERLRLFLENTLVSDNHIEQIKKAFDAYIFLSYRKKDRAYAQELMKLIHKNEFCEKVAIWYDEFLIPGENFNSAIEDAIIKSDLFSLVVTPNLVNEKNYVMDMEYPLAKRNGKSILSFEMEKTEYNELKKSFIEIPKPISPYDDLFAKELKDFLQFAVKPSQDPIHVFFVGLAYLSGIDVEVDRERGLKLIVSSAESGLEEAIKKLVSMYSSGDGVTKNVEYAIEWQNRLVKQLGDKVEKTKSESDAIAFLKENMKLAELSYLIEDYENAEEICEISYKLSKILAFGTISTNVFCKIRDLFRKYILNKSYFKESIVFLFKSYRMLLDISFAMGIVDDINKWTSKAPLFFTMSRSVAYPEVATELFQISYKMAHTCIGGGNATGAKKWLDYAADYFCALEKNEKSLELRYSFSFMYNVASDYEEMFSRHSAAYKSQIEREKLLKSLFEEYPKYFQIESELIKCMIRETEIGYFCFDIDFVKSNTEKIKKQIDYLVEQDLIVNNDLLLAKYYTLTAGINYHEHNYENAVYYLQRAQDIYQPLSDSLFDAEHVRDVASVLKLKGNCYYQLGEYSKAYECHFKSLDYLNSVHIFAMQVGDFRTLSDLSEKLLQDSVSLKDKLKIQEWNEKSLWYRKGLVEGVVLPKTILQSEKKLSDEIEKDKIVSPQFDADKKALDKLLQQQKQIKSICKNIHFPNKTLKDSVFSANLTDIPIVKFEEICRAMATLIENYLNHHASIEIRIGLETLKGILCRDNFVEKTENPYLLLQIRQLADSIQEYFLNRYKPNIKYDEESVLLLIFCSYLYLYSAKRIIGGREKAFSDFLRFYKDIVFWNYPLDRIQYKDVWWVLHNWIYNTCPVNIDFK